MKRLTGKVVQHHEESAYTRYLGLDLLQRGGLTQNTSAELKRLIAVGDDEGLKALLDKYRLGPRGVDNQGIIRPLLISLGMDILGRTAHQGYRVIRLPYSNPRYPHLLGEYVHIQEVGDGLRALEFRPGYLGWEFISLYTWAPKPLPLSETYEEHQNPVRHVVKAGQRLEAKRGTKQASLV